MRNIKIKQFLKELYIGGTKSKNELLQSHPLQWISGNVSIPVWKVSYKYNLQNGKEKQHNKYIILPEYSTDEDIMSQLKIWVESYNNIHPYRSLSNVEILDMKFMDSVELILE